MFMSDNGWHLPNSKHSFTENGYRTQLLRVRSAHPAHGPAVGPGAASPPPPPQCNPALAHTDDMLPTALGFALGTAGSQACPDRSATAAPATAATSARTS